MPRYRKHRNTMPDHDVEEVPGWFTQEWAAITEPEDWYIYAAFTAAPDGSGLVKIGVSKRPMKRMGAIRHGCPFPLKVALFAKVGHKRFAFGVEASIHNALKARRTRGEWFRFDYASPDDKAVFHHATKGAYLEWVKKPLAWSRVPESVLMGAEA